MPWLQFIKIACHDTEDWVGSDEVYIRLDQGSGTGDHVWGPKPMDDGDVRWLDHEIPPRSFVSHYNITLWDQDQGWKDPDDQLGWRQVTSSSTDKGDINLHFEGWGAQYTVTVRVTSAEPAWPP